MQFCTKFARIQEDMEVREIRPTSRMARLHRPLNAAVERPHDGSLRRADAFAPTTHIDKRNSPEEKIHGTRKKKG